MSALMRAAAEIRNLPQFPTSWLHAYKWSKSWRPFVLPESPKQLAPQSSQRLLGGPQARSWTSLQEMPRQGPFGNKMAETSLGSNPCPGLNFDR